MKGRFFIILIWTFILAGCKDHGWNDPNTISPAENVRFASFAQSPKTLDPATSYYVDEAVFVSQVYEPVLQYHYLKRPYELIPQTAAAMPTIEYLDQQGKLLPDNAPDKQVATTRYIIKINPGILYQPHPAFAKDKNGNYLYQNLSKSDLRHINKLSDFKNTGTRELTADDYIYEIKRLANPQVASPIYGLMSKYIVGFEDYAKSLPKNSGYIDLRQYPLAGVKSIDRYTYEITLKGKYPQFIYWLAMTFFAPIPWEADKFYAQSGMDEKTINLTWYPVGTGAYMLTENNPNKEMILTRNPNYHLELFPSEGEPGDEAFLTRAGQKLPFIDKYIFTLEKEAIPRWNKFLQGYYDVSPISSDSFEQAVKIDERGNAQLTPYMQNKGIKLTTTVSPNVFFYGFNMLDPVVGGYTERAQKLRQAIAIALNTEEFISIFMNGRGMAGQGPIPPGIFGYIGGQAGINPYVYTWQNGQAQRRSIDEAKKLLAEAGYPNGRDIKTGKPLIINYDTGLSSAAEDKSSFDWMTEQFNKINIQLNIRATQYNRYQEKIRTGNVQLFFLGWDPDYPDPENFLFLLYGPNEKIKSGGENAANYVNPEFDRLFEQMRMMPNNPARQEIINKLVTIIQKDTPWVGILYPKQFLLTQQWVGPMKLDAMGNNNLKYLWIDPKLRVEKQAEWNKPKTWPLFLILGLLLAVLLPVVIEFWKKQRRPGIKKLDTRN